MYIFVKYFTKMLAIFKIIYYYIGMAQQQEHEGKPESSSSQPESSLEPDMGTKSTMIPSTSWFTPKR